MSFNLISTNGTKPNVTLVTSTSAPQIGEAVDMTVLTSFEWVQLDGGTDIVVELIDLFLEDAPRRLASLEEAVADHDERSLRRAAHCLRGSSGSIGAPQMALICEELEHIQSEDVFPKARTLLDCLVKEFDRARQRFRVERQKRTNAKSQLPAINSLLLQRAG